MQTLGSMSPTRVSVQAYDKKGRKDGIVDCLVERSFIPSRNAAGEPSRAMRKIMPEIARLEGLIAQCRDEQQEIGARISALKGEDLKSRIALNDARRELEALQAGHKKLEKEIDGATKRIEREIALLPSELEAVKEGLHAYAGIIGSFSAKISDIDSVREEGEKILSASNSEIENFVENIVDKLLDPARADNEGLADEVEKYCRKISSEGEQKEIEVGMKKNDFLRLSRQYAEYSHGIRAKFKSDAKLCGYALEELGGGFVLGTGALMALKDGEIEAKIAEIDETLCSFEKWARNSQTGISHKPLREETKKVFRGAIEYLEQNIRKIESIKGGKDNNNEELSRGARVLKDALGKYHDTVGELASLEKIGHGSTGKLVAIMRSARSALSLELRRRQLLVQIEESKMGISSQEQKLAAMSASAPCFGAMIKGLEAEHGQKERIASFAGIELDALNERISGKRALQRLHEARSPKKKPKRVWAKMFAKKSDDSTAHGNGAAKENGKIEKVESFVSLVCAYHEDFIKKHKDKQAKLEIVLARLAKVYMAYGEINYHGLSREFSRKRVNKEKDFLTGSSLYRIGIDSRNHARILLDVEDPKHPKVIFAGMKDPFMAYLRNITFEGCLHNERGKWDREMGNPFSSLIG